MGVEEGMEGSAFPVSTAQDDEQVTTALDTASALWTRGDAREALRWLRRAAEMAGEAGDDWRAVQLARAAADLSSELQIPPTLVPASPGPLFPRAPSNPAAALLAGSAPVSYPPPSAPPRAQAAQARVVDGPPRPLVASVPRARARQALQVAVTPSQEDRTLFYVRVLSEGEPLPPGSEAALLVALDPRTDWFTRRR
ncbi:MAG TPA: hypothetical protein VI072_21880 [Polyangiaceae bacterium]